MDKETFTLILEVALLGFDGSTYEQITNDYEISKEIVDIGISLSNYLKSKEVKQ